MTDIIASKKFILFLAFFSSLSESNIQFWSDPFFFQLDESRFLAQNKYMLSII